MFKSIKLDRLVTKHRTIAGRIIKIGEEVIEENKATIVSITEQQRELVKKNSEIRQVLDNL